MWRWQHNSLTVRLTATMVIAIGVLLGVAVTAQVQLHERYADESARLNGLSLAETLYGSLHNTMFTNDRERLHQTVRTISERSPGVLVRVFDKQGVVRYSSALGEIGRTLETDADFCQRCHADSRPVEELGPGERTRFFHAAGVRTLGVIRPIRNEESCATAACHAHDPSRSLLGILDIEVSMASSDAALRRTRLLTAVIGGGALLVLTLLVLFILRRSVHRPIRRLTNTLDALGRGDYSARYEQRQELAEFAHVAQAVNRMAHELDRANAELLRWAQTLERRVEEKTAELKVAQERVMRVERMASLGKLAAVVAHEINNPLASVVTYSRLLLRRMASGNLAAAGNDTREILEAVASESARCGEIVSNLLLFARAGGGQKKLVRVGEVIDRVTFLLKHKMDLAQVGLDARLDPDLPPVLFDPGQLEQALLALCVNAIEAMPHGGTLSIRSERVDLSDEPSPAPSPAPAQTTAKDKRPPGRRDAIRVTVSDTGVGIPAEILPHIFEPFFTTKGEGESKGLGLGLAVVDGIVQSNRGTIDVRSDSGQGTTFTVVFPVADSAAALTGSGSTRPTDRTNERPTDRPNDKSDPSAGSDDPSAAGAA